MDFIVGLPNTSQRHDSIWVIIDRLTKIAHFLPVHTTYSAKKYAEVYLDQIVRLHGVPNTIISDRGAQFIARFWEQLQSALGTKLIRSSAYHPQTDGQTERVNQILEDMLRACIINYGTSWDKCLALAEFSYNNSYQSSLQMAPFEPLYGQRCRTPLSWSKTGERQIFGPDLVTEAEDKVKLIQDLKPPSLDRRVMQIKGENLTIPSRGFCLSPSISCQRCLAFRHKREVSTPICRTIRNP
jgi:hypothetical protein